MLHGVGQNLLKRQQHVMPGFRRQASGLPLSRASCPTERAANKGDKAATEAVLKMKEAGVDDRRGQR